MATWTNPAKNTATMANTSKNSATMSNSFPKISHSDLIQEDLGIILLEDGCHLLLESSQFWTNLSKT